MRHRDGSWRHVESFITNRLHDTNIGGLVLNSRDISDRKYLHDRLAHQASHDPLTGLTNRALFRERVEHALARSDRRHRPITVLFLDLDNFKIVHDTLGHAAGGQLVVAVAGRLRTCVRPADTVARLGGDESALLLEDCIDLNAASQVAARILAALGEPLALEGRDVVVQASVGIAAATVDQLGRTGADALLRDADVAMYVAKAAARDAPRSSRPTCTRPHWSWRQIYAERSSGRSSSRCIGRSFSSQVLPRASWPSGGCAQPTTPPGAGGRRRTRAPIRQTTGEGLPALIGG